MQAAPPQRFLRGDRCLAHGHEKLFGPAGTVNAWTGGSSDSRTSTGSRAPSAGQRRLSPRRGGRYLFRRVVSWGRGSNVACQRRPASYLDASAPIPSTPPRSATPSTTWSCTTRQGSGSSNSCSARPSSVFVRRNIRGVIYLFKNNTDSAGNSYGCHENYLTSRRDDFGHYVEVLIPFFVSRQIYRGGQGPPDRTGRHLLHQPAGRAHLGGRLRRHHPLAPHHQHTGRAARRRRARRLHVIVGDSNMSEYATFLQVGATSVLLRMLESPRSSSGT